MAEDYRNRYALTKRGKFQFTKTVKWFFVKFATPKIFQQCQVNNITNSSKVNKLLVKTKKEKCHKNFHLTEVHLT